VTSQKKDRRELPGDRLGSLDADGWRSYIHPARIKGYFHTRRVWFQWFLIAIFMVAPWLKFGGHQLILLDIPNRRFAFFGVTFWAHDAPMLVLVLLTATIGIMLLTALFGRVWCGWACPQTVFIERVFRAIEEWVEGDHLARRRLDQADWTGVKIQKRGTKWVLYLAASLVITHSFLAYFVGSDRLIEMISHSPFANPTPFLFVMAATAVILFDFGWFREQFCVIMCPYGRFQSALLDDHSVNVSYDPGRGEPRRGVAPSKEEEGDCINCYRCVQVCPTGIDIRRGTQLECIACTACIDACDDVMTRIDKPKGLIRYDSLKGISREEKTRYFRPRTIGYMVVWAAVIGLFGYVVTHRKLIDVSILRAKDTPYQIVSNEAGDRLVINHFRVDLSNMGFADESISLELSDAAVARGFEMVGQKTAARVVAGKHERFDFFVRFPVKELREGVTEVDIVARPSGRPEQTHRLKVVGPFK
jgi:cytochrome c oxidase accessory protein FixG